MEDWAVAAAIGIFFLGCAETDLNIEATNVTPDVDAGDAADSGNCAPKTCVQVGADCGTISDGCGGVLSCGECAQGLTCGGNGPNRCGSTSCVAKTCMQLEASCGEISDGCSAILNCGTCEKGYVCGADGSPNQCACVPSTSCASLKASCGTIVDECGKKSNCGTCGAGEICGIQVANRCGPEPCTPVSCSYYGYECGIISDGCGGTIDCGSCGSNEACHQRKCCVSNAGKACSFKCQKESDFVRGYSQYESVWCSGETQSLAQIVNCGEPDPDPCATHGDPPNCGFIPGYRWCDVSCYFTVDCHGTVQCDGACKD